ncbi:O-antigen ligase family protein (plasmid) [Anabaena sp. PCC 7938]|nr:MULTISPECIES: O-antigen ligase family protein [Anabaena]MBY5281121.1 O-antigen ligase family protein [Anabaena sp. CCAP 1446/1C]MBY5306747.1 O-antigen ligase family protein [Anabaena sp. CCAP 1446/1C]MCM2410093.1 O-antigen ligase family protein [Anabaena sp. CCAP 1446/1C]
MRSLLGHPTHLSGLIYWGLIAVFTLTNSLVLQIKPKLLKQQLQGFIAGSVILVLSIIPQYFNWTIDYTINSGQLFNNNILLSSIYKGHQPIGLYSHRGHSAFVLAAAAAAILSSWKSKIFSSKVLLILPVIITALLLTQTRAGIVALLASLVFLMGNNRIVWISAITSLVLIISISTTRQIEGISIVKQLTSDRLWIWEISKSAINKNPYHGYGLDGFNIAYPQMKNVKKEVIFTPYTKSHNLIIDWAVSIGVAGAALYLLIFGYCFFINESPLSAVVIVYLVYTMTWFESGQFTHIAWWALSLFNYEKSINNYNFTSQPKVCTSLESTVRSRISTAVKGVFRKLPIW